MAVMFAVKNLKASVDNKSILSGISLSISEGEVHAIMGPNGSGKSTLAQVIMGHPCYKAEEGVVELNGKNVLDMKPEERARAGIFMAFQYPVEIPGVTVVQALREVYRKRFPKEKISAVEFRKKVEKIAGKIKLNPELLGRGINNGFSGGEKKKFEILQLAILKPKLIILDETDSGLDVDALKIVAKGVNKYRPIDSAVLLITHYRRILKYVVPDKVHVLCAGRIVVSGDSSLANELERRGYEVYAQRKN